MGLGGDVLVFRGDQKHGYRNPGRRPRWHTASLRSRRCKLTSWKIVVDQQITIVGVRSIPLIQYWIAHFPSY